jgi:hypothetical protein
MEATVPKRGVKRDALLSVEKPSIFAPKVATGLNPGLNGAKIRVVWDDLFTEAR